MWVYHESSSPAPEALLIHAVMQKHDLSPIKSKHGIFLPCCQLTLLGSWQQVSRAEESKWIYCKGYVHLNVFICPVLSYSILPLCSYCNSIGSWLMLKLQYIYLKQFIVKFLHWKHGFILFKNCILQQSSHSALPTGLIETGTEAGWQANRLVCIILCLLSGGCWVELYHPFLVFCFLKRVYFSSVI